MKTYDQCLACFERQGADICAISKFGQKETEDVLNAVGNMVKAFSVNEPPIRMAIDIHDLVRRKSGVVDPYREIKAESNRVAHDCVPVFEAIMKESRNPLKTAIQIAIAGNIIDYGAFGLRKLSKDNLVEVINNVLIDDLVGNTVSEFEAVVNRAKRILYIVDNAGECFFDVPLLNLLPLDRVTYAVRGGPILNDATIEDAREAGVHEKCRLINTGDNAPGVIFSRCSDEFMQYFDGSDLVITKGQGNYESLSDVVDKPVVFLAKVKCEIIACDMGYKLGSNVLKICNVLKDMQVKNSELSK